MVQLGRFFRDFFWDFLRHFRSSSAASPAGLSRAAIETLHPSPLRRAVPAPPKSIFIPPPAMSYVPPPSPIFPSPVPLNPPFPKPAAVPSFDLSSGGATRAFTPPASEPAAGPPPPPERSQRLYTNHFHESGEAPMPPQQQRKSPPKPPAFALPAIPSSSAQTPEASQSGSYGSASLLLATRPDADDRFLPGGSIGALFRFEALREARANHGWKVTAIDGGRYYPSNWRFNQKSTKQLFFSSSAAEELAIRAWGSGALLERRQRNCGRG